MNINPSPITSCKECGCTAVTWQTAIVNRSNIQQGRLNTNDVECLFILGCDECLETLATISADKIAGLMNAAASPEPTIDEAKALDGKIFATLNKRESQVLAFFRDQGRKFGVSVSLINEADPEELARARSQEHADQIMKSANSRVTVTTTA